ncbi:MAG: sigma-70 family RNA polymerase sigma factor [Naasia sp.]
MSPLSTDADRARFDALVREIIDPVRGYLHRRTDDATADDVLSETLVALWRRLDDVPADAAIPWSIGVARLQLKNAERSRRRQGLLAQRIVAIDPPREVAEEDPRDDSGDRAVRRALAALKPAEAELLRLWIWEELEPREIASVLDISANAAAIRLHRARKRFAEEFRKHGDGVGHDGVKEGGGR